MNIGIICDSTLLKELGQNGIIAQFCLKKFCTIDCNSTIGQKDLEKYDLVILWTHPGDEQDYTSLKHKNLKLVEFPSKIEYRENAADLTDAWGKPMHWIMKEHPDFHFPSKYQKELQNQLRELLKTL